MGESRPPFVWTYSGTCPNCGHAIEAELPALPGEAAAERNGLDVDRLVEILVEEDGMASAWCRNDATTREFAERIAARYAEGAPSSGDGGGAG